MAKVDIYNEKEKLKYSKRYVESKKVSVVIPNYNYSKFICERIDSVLFQTYPIFELIILDDKSTDDSVNVIKNKIESVRKECNINISLIENKENSGNAFKQWKKGFELAKGDYVWIAEADDSASPYFLEEVMKPVMKDEEIVLSYSDSLRIDVDNNIIRKKSDDLYDMLKTGDWNNSYICSGIEEIKKHLSITNTILNVSSVIWKKANYSEIFEKAQEYKVAGDWYIYYNVLKKGKISFVNKSLNYFRKHNLSVSTIVKKELEFEEICKIQNDIRENFDLTSETIKAQEIRKNNMRKLVRKISKEHKLLRDDLNKKYVAWVMPIPGKGSGGHRTIIQNVNYLVEQGYVCDIYIPDDGYISERQMQKKVQEYYGECLANVYVDSKISSGYDIAIATGNNTVELVKKSNAKYKAYFVQDYEPYFYPMSDRYIAAESTYYEDLNCITIGKWLAHKLNTEYGRKVKYFNFCADLNNYYKDVKVKKENAICAIYQPNKPRRCDELLIKALEIVSNKRPDIKIYLYGSNTKTNFNFKCENLNIIPIEKCNELYNKCILGISMSSSNPSRIPFEMMAAGLPVIDLYRENNLYDIPDSAAILSLPTVEEVAGNILDLLGNTEKLNEMSKNGIEYMKEFPLEKGFNQFENAIEEILNNNFITDAGVDKKIYNIPAKSNKIILENKDLNLKNVGEFTRKLRRIRRLPKIALNAINKRINKG